MKCWILLLLLIGQASFGTSVYQIGQDEKIKDRPMEFYLEKIMQATSLTTEVVPSNTFYCRYFPNPFLKKMDQMTFEHLEVFFLENGDAVWIGNRPNFKYELRGYHPYHWLFVAYVKAKSQLALHSMMLNYVSPEYNEIFSIRDRKVSTDPSLKQNSVKPCELILGTPVENRPVPN